jgi:hypothetical protein
VRAQAVAGVVLQGVRRVSEDRVQIGLAGDTTRFYSQMARVLLLWPMSRVTAHFAALDRDDDGDDA